MKKDFELIKRCFGYLRPYWRYVVGMYVMMVLIELLGISIPQLMGWMVDAGVVAGDRDVLLVGVVGLLVVALVRGVFVFLQGVWSEIASQWVARDLRNGIQGQLLALSFSFHDQTETGQLLSRGLQDVERIRFLTGRAVLRLTGGVVQIVMTLVVLFWMNGELALFVLLLLPIFVARAYQYGRQYRPLSFDIQDQLGVLTARIEQNLRGIGVVKGFAQEAAEIERFREQNEEWFGMSMGAAQIQAVNGPLLDLIANAGTVFVLWYGGRLVMGGVLSLGELVAFLTYLSQLVRPVRLFGRVVPILAIAASAAERIFSILDEEPTVENRPGAVERPLAGRVEFEAVSFKYGRRAAYAVEGISFVAEAGQMVALLGATGAGKSTIIRLLARFYEPTEGRVLFDGDDGRALDLRSLRRQIGMVMQDTRLFAATIRENIAFGRPEATDEEVEAAARAAQAHAFISQMENGYDSEVGERGVTLSGGQKQRLSIARALLTNPRILVLDDATASVDTGTEALIQKALEELMVGRTTLVIAHRLSTVRRADLILLLEGGRIVARGTHDELLATSELYRKVYDLQLRPQLEVSDNV
ncbi:MAG TPA: ABC transporter ATP-binding protein [Anaerolineae bacterium]|nr:ABC transporter ATP-binding protein [Anaerolineae bacterium]